MSCHHFAEVTFDHIKLFACFVCVCGRGGSCGHVSVCVSVCVCVCMGVHVCVCGHISVRKTEMGRATIYREIQASKIPSQFSQCFQVPYFPWNGQEHKQALTRVMRLEGGRGRARGETEIEMSRERLLSCWWNRTENWAWTKYALRTKSIQVKLLMFVFTDSAGEAPVANARDLMLKKFIPSSHKWMT